MVPYFISNCHLRFLFTKGKRIKQGLTKFECYDNIHAWAGLVSGNHIKISFGVLALGT
jgi:hypothetical protein